MTIIVRFIIAVAVAIVLDVISGLFACLKNGKFKSSIMRQGLLSKSCEMFVVLVFVVIEKGLPFLNIPLQLPFVQIVSLYIIVMEFGSLIENIGKVNPKVAKVCKNLFDEFKKGVGVDEDN